MPGYDHAVSGTRYILRAEALIGLALMGHVFMAFQAAEAPIRSL